MDGHAKRDVAVTVRLRHVDLQIIDRGAKLSGVSRNEFVRRAALHDAQLAVLNETMIQLSPQAFADFLAAIDAPPQPTPPKLHERLARSGSNL